MVGRSTTSVVSVLCLERIIWAGETENEETAEDVACDARRRVYTNGQLLEPFMANAVGFSAYSAGPRFPSCAAPGRGSVAALEGRIRQDRIQLNDWTRCVSAKTSRGQAEIQKLSGEISAAKEQIARSLQDEAGALSPASVASGPDAQSANAAVSLTAREPSRQSAVDLWV